MATTTKLSICNGALQKIGVPRIASIDEASKEGRICNSEFDKARRAVLRMYHWSFATKRVVLSPLVNVPAFEYEYTFELPSDCLRVLSLFEYYDTHRVEGLHILANSDTLNLVYTADVEDFTQIDDLFVDALEWFLGYTIARYLTESETTRQEALQGFKSIMPLAKFVQSTEHSQPVLEADDLLLARNGRFVRDPGT
jgi:hypothetical protein